MMQPLAPRWIRGYRAAARYIGLSDPKTLRNWVIEYNLKPRVIKGRSYFDVTELERLMDPTNNINKTS